MAGCFVVSVKIHCWRLLEKGGNRLLLGSITSWKLNNFRLVFFDRVGVGPFVRCPFTTDSFFAKSSQAFSKKCLEEDVSFD